MALLCVALGSLAATIIVDGTGETPDLQTALDASGPGDRVLVRPGVYTGRFVVPADVELVGAGPELTTLDGETLGATVTLGSGALLEGFTVTGGSRGGVRADNPVASLPPAIVRGNVIHGNVNDIPPRYGGGAGGVLFLEDNVVRDNATLGSGGGVSMTGCSGIASGNLIVNNEANWRGGGIYVEAACSLPASLLITDNVISGNTAGTGAGIYAYRYVPDNFPVVTHNTIVGNSASSAVGGVEFFTYAEYIGYPERKYGALTNNIIAGNPGGGVRVTHYYGGAGYGYGPIVENNLLFDNGPFDLIGESAIGSDGNIAADPVFLDPAAGNYRLTPGSPAIDTGAATPAPPPTDIDGNPRPLDGDLDGLALPDRGAHEERGELENLRIGSDRVTVGWNSRAGIGNANLYRGDLSVLKDGGTYTQHPGTVPAAESWCDLPANRWSDFDTPAIGITFFYLATPAGSVEGSLGLDSARQVRPNANPCP